MSSIISSKEIYNNLDKLFPNAKCGLEYNNLFELLISVVLSAQTTDVAVNKVTKTLFSKYPDSYKLARANLEEVKEIIKSIGLANNKAKNIILLSKELNDRFNGIIPSNLKDLESLRGVGHKSASVVLCEGFKIPAVPVDTHIFRIARRLGISNGKDVKEVENDIKQMFDEDTWCHLHHLLIAFGRNICKAKNPNCDECPFNDKCKNKDHIS